MEQPAQFSGLEEAIDQFFIAVMETLTPYYSSQQGQPQAVDIRSLWNKQGDISYPFLGVLTNVDRNEPAAIGDLFYESNNAVDFRNTINDVKTGILIQCEEIRELQRLRSFIEINLMWGRNPDTYLPWLQHFRDYGGIVINGFTCSEYQRVGFESIVQRTSTVQGKEIQRRADIETLWEVQLDVVCSVECAVQLSFSGDPNRSIITGINYVLSPR